MHSPEFILKLRYELWPWLKVRCKYYFWIVRYGGKKRIPQEVVFRSMAKSLARMNDNLDAAYKLAANDPNAPSEEVHKILQAMNQGQALQETTEKLDPTPHP